MDPKPNRRPLLAWLVVGAALAAAAGVFALRRSTEPVPPIEPSLDSLPLPELMDKVLWSLSPDEEQAVGRAFAARGRPAAEALLASLRTNTEAGDRSLPYLARLRRESPDPALRDEIDQALRPVFPLKVLIIRSISDEEAQRQAALTRAQPGEQVEYWYDPMGSKTLGQEEVEVTSLRGLVDLLAEENPRGLDRLTFAFTGDYVHRFGDEEVVPELKRAAHEVRTARGAALTLARLQRAQAAPFLLELLKAAEPALRAAGCRGIEELGGDAQTILPQLLELMGAEAHRSAAQEAVLSIVDSSSEDSARLVLMTLASATDAPTRISLLEVACRLPVTDGVSLAPLEALVGDPDEAVAQRARETIETLRARAQSRAEAERGD